jgi:hypothetical protein
MKKLSHKMSYFIGLIHADGCLSESKIGNKGKLSIELKADDSSILTSLGVISGKKYGTYERIRDTNFKKNYKSKVLYICDLEFRRYLKSLGMIAGKKDRLVTPPKEAIDFDYIRGYLDGNGSLGYTEKKIPIISITTKSENVKQYVLKYIFNVIGKIKNINRNVRDDIYNIVLTGEDAVSFVKYLYYNSEICMPRKFLLAKSIMNWSRPYGLKRIPDKKFWTKNQDEIILNNSLVASIRKLGRSKKSIMTRVWRLTGKCKIKT